MPNRAQRRAAQRNQPSYKRMSVEARAAALVKNGITMEDLKEAREQGYKMGIEGTISMCYAAFCLALKEQFDFNREQALRALKAADEKIVMELDSTDLIDEVLEKFNVQLEFRSALDRVQEIEEN